MGGVEQVSVLELDGVGPQPRVEAQMVADVSMEGGVRRRIADGHVVGEYFEKWAVDEDVVG